MQNTIKGAIAIVAVSAAVGCSQRPAGSSEFSAAVTAPTSPSLAASTGGTMKEALTGPAIGGVVPEGQALADMSRFADGGSTTLSVQIKKVNLPDGTVLTVALDFTPLGSIALRSGEGTLTVSLGHFGVSRDQVAVKYGSATILSGGRFN